MAFFVSSTFMPGESISMPSKPASLTALNFSVNVPGTLTIPNFNVFHSRPLSPSPSTANAAIGAAAAKPDPVTIEPAAATKAAECRKPRREK